VTDHPSTQNVRPEDLPYVERPPLITRPRKHYLYPSQTEVEMRAARDGTPVEGLTPGGPDPALQQQRRADVRRQIEQRQQQRIRQRILGIRAANRTMPVREIAYRVGVSREQAQAALGETDPPQAYRLNADS
jgi:hypothetical protein